GTEHDHDLALIHRRRSIPRTPQPWNPYTPDGGKLGPRARMSLENLAASRESCGRSEKSLDTEQGTTYRVVQEVGGVALYTCHWGAGPADRPFEEQHAAFSISLVERGVFTYRSISGKQVLGPGWLMLGNEGDGYVCSHEHGDGHGDDCVVIGFRPET